MGGMFPAPPRPGLLDDVELVALDVDGTLVEPGGSVHPRTVQAIRSVQAAGVRVMLSTGRQVRTTTPYARACELDGPMVCYQGAVVAAPGAPATDWLVHRPLPRELVVDVVTSHAATTHINLYVDDQACCQQFGAGARLYEQISGTAPEVVDDLAALARSADSTKLVFVEPDLERMEALATRVRDAYGSFAWVSRSLPEFLELCAPGVSKASGVEAVAALWGYEAGQVLACGDADNDRDMLEWAGVAAVPTGAAPAVGALADLRIAPPSELGVAQLLETLASQRAERVTDVR